MKVMIKVLKNHIKKGAPGICKSCPVALAINRHLKKGFGSLVAADFVNFYTEAAWFDAPLPECGPQKLPKNAQAFISGVDLGKKVIPISFVLEIPDKLLKKRVTK